MDNQEKMRLLSQMLVDAHIEFQRERHKTVSQATFSKWLGVPTTSLSQWINELRLPTGDNVHKLASKLGPKVYDILEMPRMMPLDKTQKELYSIWYDLTEQEQIELLEFAKAKKESKLTGANESMARAA